MRGSETHYFIEVPESDGSSSYSSRRYSETKESKFVKSINPMVSNETRSGSRERIHLVKEALPKYDNGKAESLKKALDGILYSSTGLPLTSSEKLLKTKSPGSQPVTAGRTCQIRREDLTLSELLAFLLFSVLGVSLLFITGVLLDDTHVPSATDNILAGESLSSRISVSKHKYYDLQFNIEKDDYPKTFVLEVLSSEINPTLVLWRRPSTQLISNDDIQDGFVFNSSVIFTIRKESDTVGLVADVSSFLDLESGEFRLSFSEIEETFFADEFQQSELLVNQPDYHMIELEDSLYYFYSFLPGVEDLPDTTLRIFDLDGIELIEVFQSSPYDFTAKMMFRPPSPGLYVLETRSISRIPFNATVFFQTYPYTTLELGTTPITIQGDLFSVNSIILQVQLKEEFTYKFSVDSKLNESLPIISSGRTFAETRTAAIYNMIFPGVAFRIDAENNKRLLTEVSNITATFDDLGEMLIDDIEYNVSSLNLAVSSSVFTFVPPETGIYYIDMCTSNPRFIDLEFDTVIGNYSMTITSEQSAPNVDDLLTIDPRDPYATCNDNPQDLTIFGECDTGIWVFCGYESDDIVGSVSASTTTEEIEEFCDCVSFLCANIKGENFSKEYSALLRYFNIALMIISGVCTALLLKVVFDTFCYELAYHTRLATVIQAIVFFLTALSYFYILLRLGRSGDTIKDLNNLFVQDTQSIDITSVLELSLYNLDPLDQFIDMNKTAAASETQFVLPMENISDSLGDITFHSVRSVITAREVLRVIYITLAVATFAHITMLWIEVRLFNATLNAKERDRLGKMLTKILVFFEIALSAYVLYFTVRFITTNGESYDNKMTIITTIVCFLIAVLNLLGRVSIAGTLSKLETKTVDIESYIGSIVKNIRTTSSIIVGANLGLSITLLYRSTRINSFDALVESQNDLVLVTMSTFEDICIFIGMAFVTRYVFRSHNLESSAKLSREASVEDTIPPRTTRLALERGSFEPLFNSNREQSLNLDRYPNFIKTEFYSMPKTQISGVSHALEGPNFADPNSWKTKSAKKSDI